MSIRSVEHDFRFKKEILAPETREGYRAYAWSTWNSILEMIYPETGLPSDHLHYPKIGGGLMDEPRRVDKTSLTDIGFSLACVGAATAMNFIQPSEAHQRIDQTLRTLEQMMNDSNIFIPTTGGKGLLANWINPSTGEVLREWPGSNSAVKQHVSTVDMAWIIAFSRMTSAQFPQFNERIQSYLNKIDLDYMFDPESGFFHGSYNISTQEFENWKYDVMSEARIAYFSGDERIAEAMGKLIGHRSERSRILDSHGHQGRATYSGSFFEMGWPSLLIPEDERSPLWAKMMQTTIQMQKDHGAKHSDGHYGFSAGLGPDDEYHIYRVPAAGETIDEYVEPKGVITVAALINMALLEPVETYLALTKLHNTFPALVHPDRGDGDTVDVKTGVVQSDQLMHNQATILITCWNIVKDHEPQDLFMNVSPAITDIYRRYPLWES